jgi:hypothetical protein
MSTAHTAADVQATLEAADGAFAAVAVVVAAARH